MQLTVSLDVCLFLRAPYFAGTILPTEQSEAEDVIESLNAQTYKAHSHIGSPSHNSRRADARGRVRCVTLITNEKLVAGCVISILNFVM